MKNNTLGRLIGVIMLLGAGLLACEKGDVNRTFEGPYFVRFTDTTLTYKESYSKPIALQVHNVGPILNEPITISYTVTGTAREGREYRIVGTKGTVVIPAGKSTGAITLQLINNANNILESTSLTFTIAGVQPNTLQIGYGNDVRIGKQFTLVIQDDCLLGGYYTGTQTHRTQTGPQTVSVPDIRITSSDCKQYTVGNWNLGLLDFNAQKPTLTFIDNGDNSLTVPTQSNTELGATDNISGTGAWNPRTRTVTLNLKFKLAVTSTKDTTIAFTQTYTPQ